jgi:chain length determinant protein tyrosine kinase EpsG
LRSQLILRWFSEGRKTLAVVSPHAGCGSSYIAANLAVIWSQMGERTLLIDADLKHGRQHELFNVKNQVGLSNVLAGRGSMDSVIKPVPLFRGLSLLTAGAPPPNPGELLERKELKDIVERALEDYSVVIFDTPAMDNTNGWEFVASQCSDALLVIRKNKTQLSTATKMIKRIRSLNAEVVGSVLTDF